VGARPASIKRHEQERRAEREEEGRREGTNRGSGGEEERAVGAAWREICLCLLAVLLTPE